MYLLVIGLVAVIVAFLVAAFFSLRRGHDDEDEPARRPSVRNRIRSRGGDARDRDPRWDSAGPPRQPARRPGGRGPAPSRRPSRDTSDRGRPDRYERAGYDQSRGYEPSSRGYGERAQARGYDGQRSERTPSARRSPRYDDATETVVQAAARPARNGKAAPSARPGGDDSFGTGPVTALYDTGPSAAAADDYATAQVNADPDLADSDVFPRVRADIPRPARKARPRSQPKARGSRPSRKHDDDDDWPSTEWDKLSDEQYWAELSADKPLATTARSAQSSSPAAPKPARGPAARPAATPRPDRDRAAASADRPASRRSREPDRGAQDDATQQLDARPGIQPGSRPPAARPRGAQAPEAGDRDARAPRPGSRGGRPAPGRDYEPTERMPSRSRPRAASDRPASSAPAGTGPMSAGPMPTGPIGTGPMGSGPSTGPITGPADPAPRRPAPRRPAGDDPLTSPAYARDTSPGGDSRSYRSSGRPAQRAPGRGGAEESRGYPRTPARADYPAAPAQYESYPAAADGARDYQGTPSRGYPASPGERTDPNAGRPAAPAGYPASPPPARPSYDDGRPAETTSPQAGAGNPYGSFVDSPPPQPDSTGPTYPAAPANGSTGGYGSGPAGNYPAPGGYPDPYAPPRDGYPAAAGQGAQDPGATYYSAPPPAAAGQPAAYPYPASTGGYQDSPGYQNGAAYPDGSRYQNGAGYPDGNEYPGSNGYPAANGQHAQPGQAGYGSRYADDGQQNAQQNARYPGGPGTDPYGPDGYGGYHSRQG